MPNPDLQRTPANHMCPHCGSPWTDLMDVRTTTRNPAPPKSDFFHCYVCFHIWIVPRTSPVSHLLRSCPCCAAARGVLVEERFGALKFCCLDCEHVWDVLTPTAPHRPDAA